MHVQQQQIPLSILSIMKAVIVTVNSFSHDKGREVEMFLGGGGGHTQT